MFESILINLTTGLIGAIGASCVVFFSAQIRNWYLNRKFQISGHYLTSFEDIVDGETVTAKAPANINQNGVNIKGETELTPGKSWVIEGKVSTNGIYGVYFAKSIYDTGVGNFFLQKNSNGDLEGIWSGFDHENKMINSGKYFFHKKIKINVFIDTKGKYTTNILDLSSRTLGVDYLTKNDFTDQDVVFVACDKKTNKFLGFSRSKYLNESSLKKELKNKEISQFKDIVYSSQKDKLVIINTVAVEPFFQGRGIGRKIVKETIQSEPLNEAEVIISTAWKGKKGVNIGGVLSSLGFVNCHEFPKFWHEESKELNYKCPDCGIPCNCSAVMFKHIKSNN
ncbi:GNAT family N-acetyltransferase [Desulfoluna spongiiphila]|uniref:Uncharacterized protein n=1 Tax=Desulfoluna spongiiphila TaxID=419481 RepID=A0A1G5H063_9BACT|nr:GNAT family N-acetyltransferase [Desulfoluna spongiiphila]SCY56949.1 hypothetical protein SAMN05216233_11212 [Desulfoluna spongiiphila]